MLGEESDSANYWQKCGEDARRHGVKHIIIMVCITQQDEEVATAEFLQTDQTCQQGAHWATTHDEIQVATALSPGKDRIGGVHPRKYVDYKLVPDPAMAEMVIHLLRNAGFNCNANPTICWNHDIYTILIRMFPDGDMPPTTVLSCNARFDPHFHIRMGTALRSMREEPDVLFIGTGGAVHNLYRNLWGPITKYADNFALEVPPGNWALDFRQEFEDAMKKCSGPELRRALASLMKLPGFRDAHGTDDHYVSALFVAGLVGEEEDRGTPVVLAAEDWELGNMCNSQYTLGSWDRFPVVPCQTS